MTLFLDGMPSARNDSSMRRLIAFVFVIGVLGSCATTQNADLLPLEPAVSTTADDGSEPLVFDRLILDAVLSDGPGRFLQRMPVQPAHSKEGFLGYRVLALYGQDAQSQPHPDGVYVGDVVTAVNGVSIRRPGDLMKIWNSLPEAKHVVVDVQREAKHIRITIPIVN